MFTKIKCWLTTRIAYNACKAALIKADPAWEAKLKTKAGKDTLEIYVRRELFLRAVERVLDK